MQTLAERLIIKQNKDEIKQTGKDDKQSRQDAERASDNATEVSSGFLYNGFNVNLLHERLQVSLSHPFAQTLLPVSREDSIHLQAMHITRNKLRHVGSLFSYQRHKHRHHCGQYAKNQQERQNNRQYTDADTHLVLHKLDNRMQQIGYEPRHNKRQQDTAQSPGNNKQRGKYSQSYHQPHCPVKCKWTAFHTSAISV